MKRLDGVSRSPVFATIAESLDGVVTIRAFGIDDLVLAKFHRAHDANARAYFAFVALGRWLGFRLDAICATVLIFGVFGAALAGHYNIGANSTNAGLLGASLVYLIRLAGLFQWTVRQTAEMENVMVSVERLLQYTRIDSEAALTSSDPPPADWPTRGHLVLSGVTLRYRPKLPPALVRVSFEVAAGSLVGIVGRTGAGKSTLIAALFRLAELSAGHVAIDGVICAGLGLHELRPRLALIMQSPFLFAGTLRQNLDPLGAHPDERMWSALEEVTPTPLIIRFSPSSVSLRSPPPLPRHVRTLAAGGTRAARAWPRRWPRRARLRGRRQPLRRRAPAALPCTRSAPAGEGLGARRGDRAHRLGD